MKDNKTYFVKLEKETSSEEERQRIHRMFINERIILERLSHAHIVKFVEYIESAEFARVSGKVTYSDAIVLELAVYGDMFEDMGRNGPYSEGVARHYFNQLINCKAHL